MKISQIDIPWVKTILKLFVVVCFVVFQHVFCIAQDKRIHNHSNAILLKFDYGVQFPVGKLSEEFGSNFVFSSNVEYLLSNSYFFGLSYDYLFGKNVKVDALSSIRTPTGHILSTDNSYAELFLRERAAFMGFTIGKIFPRNPENNKTGIRVSFSPGLFKHQIRFVDENNTAPQIAGDYGKGYDLKSGGFGLKMFLGYQWMSIDKKKNFVIGLESLFGITNDLRPINFNTQELAEGTKFDQLYGLKISWMFPFYRDTSSSEEIYY